MDKGTCRSLESHVRIVLAWKVTLAFQKFPTFFLTSPLIQLSEKSGDPVFTKCGEPWKIHKLYMCTKFVFCTHAQFAIPVISLESAQIECFVFR